MTELGLFLVFCVTTIALTALSLNKERVAEEALAILREIAPKLNQERELGPGEGFDKSGRGDDTAESECRCDFEQHYRH